MAVSRSTPPGVIEPGVLTRDLHLTSPAMRGDDVRALQQALADLGYAPGAADGVFGPATAAAVSAFQADHGLEVDGWVGARTRDALVDARPSSDGNGTGNGNGGGTDAGRLALAEALQHVGTIEQPVNRTSFGRWYGVDGVPWCNIFVSYAFLIGADYTICAGFRGPGVNAKGCAYVPTTEAWLRNAGLWRGKATPAPGDIAIFNWDGGTPDHIGIVVQDLGGGAFETVEGNTSPTDNSNGGMVMRRRRTLSQVDGFGRVR